MQNFPLCTSGCGSQNTKTPPEGVTNQTSEDMDFSTNAVSKFTSSIFPGNVLSLRYSLWVRRRVQGHKTQTYREVALLLLKSTPQLGLRCCIISLMTEGLKKLTFLRGQANIPLLFIVLIHQGSHTQDGKKLLPHTHLSQVPFHPLSLSLIAFFPFTHILYDHD